MIYSSGIKKVIYLKSYAEYKGLPKDEGIDFLERFGIKTMKYDNELVLDDELI